MVYFKNGDIFKGLYVRNMKNGHGIYRWADGAEESGEYADGEKHGWHHWRRGNDEWDLLYGRGAVVSAHRPNPKSKGRAGAQFAPTMGGGGPQDRGIPA